MMVVVLVGVLATVLVPPYRLGSCVASYCAALVTAPGYLVLAPIIARWLS